MVTLPAPLIFTRYCQQPDGDASLLTLALTAEDRLRTRHFFTAQTQDGEGQEVYLQLPRGSVLQDGDRLTTDYHDAVLQIGAKPEPVMTVTATTPLSLLKAAYHLGNRHVTLEIQDTYLRFSPDPVLKQLSEQLGLSVVEEIVTFKPEVGAYRYGHPHPHAHNHSS